ncbi:TPA: ribosomal L7Ae/L30e/S12e/Gadd45 family protein [Clostridium botulinum]|uniref:Ribosomal protein L7Ae family protein n=1 Tax=Clostridium botulinum B str. Osaka05 TaxID=1407017 RepID=A0A0S6U6Q3_CLOBO|nr:MULTISPECIES: ribosomal L7Ae/L30e/S12e/Gadd45 family protein [Clostridium]AUM96200.1 ribosomal protein L7Ae family protein [Clostridium sporogenes]AVQ53654.1 50S ribosomal protein L7ae-like protein [Clostridium botulinum]EJE7235827.1 ribosomal L7Ae/L30e/S12e/Gadd45 family protein [Clostridium botulinum]EKO1912292.1 ribosomal L7Ae/L30e/S12e/Gadd45 family protein [Clostridium botulinum]EKO2042353.1 ribosomal L7Ae/L30e/S12e/Gadd45 family protein [Clostridium botulinum]
MIPNKFLQFLSLTKKAGHLIEGYNKCEEAVTKKIVYAVIISCDASENSKNKFKVKCEKSNIPLIEGYSEKELGNVLGRDFIKILAVKDEGMANKLLKLWNDSQEH